MRPEIGNAWEEGAMWDDDMEVDEGEVRYMDMGGGVVCRVIMGDLEENIAAWRAVGGYEAPSWVLTGGVVDEIPQPHVCLELPVPTVLVTEFLVSDLKANPGWNQEIAKKLAGHIDTLAKGVAAQPIPHGGLWTAVYVETDALNALMTGEKLADGAFPLHVDYFEAVNPAWYETPEDETKLRKEDAELLAAWKAAILAPAEAREQTTYY